jgi:small subunit ribosomal protein S14
VNSFELESFELLALVANKKEIMARTSQIAKSNKKPKFSTRQHNRCKICGRSRAYLRKFGLCRLHFRDLALRGEIPGVAKSSW